jgi:hypothetical protein
MNLLDIARGAVLQAPPGPALEDVGINPDVARRRQRALAMLDGEPNRQIALVAEAGDPAHVSIAIRGVAVGEIEVDADRYDAFTLLALVEAHESDTDLIKLRTSQT